MDINLLLKLTITRNRIWIWRQCADTCRAAQVGRHYKPTLEQEEFDWIKELLNQI